MNDKEAAFAHLGQQTNAVQLRDYKTGLGDDTSGLYSWWVDETGRAHLEYAIGFPLQELIYAGQAGATKWPSGKLSDATIRSRITTNHLSSSIGGSTLRWTLASLLVAQLHLVAPGPKKLNRESERRLTDWMLDHLSVATYPYTARDRLGEFEGEIVLALDPPLNLAGVPNTPLRTRLSELRRQLGRSDPPQGDPPERPEEGMAMPNEQRVTLHEELVAILQEHRDWMTTAELAESVARRGRYVKRDGTSNVSAFQVHGRTKNYPHLFERDGQRVRLRHS